jgi:hypothetical protein
VELEFVHSGSSHDQVTPSVSAARDEHLHQRPRSANRVQGFTFTSASANVIPIRFVRVTSGKATPIWTR